MFMAINYKQNVEIALEKAIDYTLDINGIQRNSIPTSDRIPGACVKRTLPKVKMPAGKTIGIAYNKGNYQVVDAADIKTMGKKI